MNAAWVQDCTDARSATRSSLYLAAALYCDGASVPVTVRNISATGALVDSASVPPDGALVQLVRGQLIVHALVVRTAPGRFGLKFSGLVDVQQWRASTLNAGQQRVDDMVKQVKAGAMLPADAPGEGDTAPVPASLAGDLIRATRLLERLGEALAGEPGLVARHAADLQALDIASQLIGAVATAIGAGCAPRADAARLAGLRRSADQALSRSG